MGLGYNSQVFTQAIFDLDDYFSSKSDCESWPSSSLYDRFQPSGGYHVVPPLYTRTFMPPKPDLVFNTTLTTVETDHLTFNVQHSPTKPDQDLSHTTRPTPPIIKDWVSDYKDEYETKALQIVPSFVQGNHKQYAPLTQTNPQKHLVPNAVLTQSKPVFTTAVRPVSAAVPKINVTRPRHAHPIVTKSKSPIRRHLTCSSSPNTSNSPPRVIAIQAPVGNPQHALKDKEVIDSGCSRHMIGNMSYLSDFEEVNHVYVAFGGNPKGGKISGKGKIKTVLLRVTRENNMYNVNLKNIVPSGDLTCLFAKATIDESNSWHRRLGHINFKTINKLVKGNLVRGLPTKVFENDNTCVACKKGKQHSASCKFEGKVDEGFLVRYYNNDGDAAFDGKEHDFDAKKPESEVNVSLRNSAQDLSADFEDCSDNNSNEVNVAGAIGLTVGQNSPNSTNTFSATGPLNAAASPTYGKFSFIDAFQLLDDPDMPALEDITYSDDEDDVGVEAAFNNLESSIIVSLIPTTRVYKDHPVSQIIDDLSSTTQTRSMTRVVQDQGGLSHMFDNDFYTCMFACFLSQEEPKRVHQALKDPSWIEAIQEELLQFKMQKVWVLVDFSHGKRAIGHTQEEVIDYEEVFASVVRIGVIRLFLAYATFMGFMVYQMDVKSAFLYGTIKEEVYVCQPPGFHNPDHLDKVYKVVKALYGLHQAPRAWYETFANYLLENGFQRGKIDQTLFIKRWKGDILLVHIYVDDIIFCATNKDLCKSFEKLMKDKLQMSSLGELTFFLASTPIYTKKPLLKDPDGEDVDVHAYRSMIGSLMYLTSSRPNIMLPVNDITRLQVLVDKKKVVVIEAANRESMSAKRTSWNEFSSAMASAIIYISTEKGFSGVETPLFEEMLVGKEIEKKGDEDEHIDDVTAGDDAQGDDTAAYGKVLTITQEPSIPSPTPPTPPPQPSQDLLLTFQVQLTTQHNVLANVQQHTDQSRSIYDTYVLEKIDSNTTIDSTNMCHRGGEIDQDAEQDQAKTTLICNLKNQMKSVKEASNEAKLKMEINVLGKINIELESSMAKLLVENEKLQHLSNTKVLTVKMDNPSRANTKQALGRGENKKADALSKIASTSFAHLRKQVLVKKLKEKTIDKKEVLAVVKEEGSTWMTLIYEYLTKEILTEKKKKARVIRRKAVAIDYFTKWIEEKPVATITGAQIKKFAHRTMIKSSNRETPFSRMYATEAVILVEISVPTLRTTEVDIIKNDESLEINLDLLKEKREQAVIQEEKSKAKIKKYYNARVRNTSFRPRDLVYQNNEASHVEEGGKLGSKWEGSYEVTETIGKGAYKLRDRKVNVLPRAWNVCSLKKCYVHEM
uniref:Uncharacterized protein n=1 Tax=Tanacetum cinerariifolium TaxID=118510 RepID=A0A6L2M2L9_TANCI|nr:hypothetical protein [Tanacetum cinerariifolium]